MTHILFIINGTKKLNNVNQHLIQLCKADNSLQTTIQYTHYSKEIIKQASNILSEKYNYVIAVGGDGTINEVVNALMQLPGNKPILGILPNGTGNDYVKSAKLKLNHEEFIKSIQQSNYKNVDLGKIEMNGNNTYFLNVADVGFGGTVIYNLTTSKFLFKSYSLAILKTFLTYKPVKLRITNLNKISEQETLITAVCIGSTFGNGLVINPKATTQSGIFQLTTIGNVSMLDYLKHLFKLKRGEIINHPKVNYWETNELIIETMGADCRAEMDGEYFLLNKAKFTILPGAIKLLDY